MSVIQTRLLWWPSFRWTWNGVTWAKNHESSGTLPGTSGRGEKWPWTRPESPPIISLTPSGTGIEASLGPFGLITRLALVLPPSAAWVS